jgi:hypothetical protein
MIYRHGGAGNVAISASSLGYSLSKNGKLDKWCSVCVWGGRDFIKTLDNIPYFRPRH